MQNEAIEVKVGRDAKLVAEFVLRGDRFRQVISLAYADGDRTALLESVEGTKEDAWPASPPLQNLSLETLTAGRRVAFLVGMAGGSHWSASVEALAERGLAFDVACRHGALPGWVGSTYRMLSDTSPRVMIEGDVAVRADGDLISAGPKEMKNQSGTTRWRYLVRVQA
jgi:hypothetical protein